MPIEMIKGAKEYYEYTKTLSEEEAKALTAGEGSKFREMVGLETPDDYTVIYHCITEKPYFDSLASYVCLYPMSQAMVVLVLIVFGHESLHFEVVENHLLCGHEQ